MKIAIIVVLVLVIAVPGTMFFTHTGPFAPAAEGEEAAAEHEEEDPHAAPSYLTLDPPFVVNFMHRGTLRYLQLSLDLMFHKPELVEETKAVMPEVRNDIIMLLSRQDFESLSTTEGKEHLRDEIRLAVNHVLDVEPAEHGSDEEEGGKESHAAKATDGVGDVYITNFVMQ